VQGAIEPGGRSCEKIQSDPSPHNCRRHDFDKINVAWMAWRKAIRRRDLAAIVELHGCLMSHQVGVRNAWQDGHALTEAQLRQTGRQHRQHRADA
jgi:hypothetical protein